MTLSMKTNTRLNHKFTKAKLRNEFSIKRIRFYWFDLEEFRQVYKQVKIITGDYSTGVIHLFEGEGIRSKIVVIHKKFTYLELHPIFREVFDNHWSYFPVIMYNWMRRNPIGVIQAKSWEELVCVLLGNNKLSHRDLDSVYKTLSIMRKLNMMNRHESMFYFNPQLIVKYR